MEGKKYKSVKDKKTILKEQGLKTNQKQGCHVVIEKRDVKGKVTIFTTL